MRRLYLLFLLPALVLSLFLVALFRQQGYTAFPWPVWAAFAALPALVMLACWVGYARFLAGFAPMDRPAALRLDLTSYLPFTLTALYFVPAARTIPNVGTLLVAGALALCAAIKGAVLIHYRRERVAAALSRPYLALGLILLPAALLRVSLIAAGRFHSDEALFAYWARLIASGQDIFLRSVAVDKPPVFFYTLALSFRLFGPSETAARIPNVMAGLAGIAVLYGIAHRLYGRRTATLAALFLALSPFDIQYAPTAFTDPLMVTLSLAAGLLALKGRCLSAGLVLGLALMTKPQAVFFLPLVLLPALAQAAPARRLRTVGRSWALIAVGCLPVLALVALWDGAIRPQPPFMAVAAAHYGGLDLVAPGEILPRLQGWLAQMRYLTGSAPLNVLLIVGIPGLLAVGLARRRLGWFYDWVLVAFAVGFVLVHSLLSFAVWDRYLLPMAPVVALLLARIVLLPGELLRAAIAPTRVAYGTLAAALLVGVLAAPMPTVLQYGFPVGSDHGAYEGIDDVAAYFRGNVPAGAIVFHHWLGWHYAYYMYGYPYTFEYYPSPEYLAQFAQRLPEAEKWLTLPTWVPAGPIQQELQQAGFALQERYRTYRSDGAVTFTVYRLAPQGPAHHLR